MNPFDKLFGKNPADLTEDVLQEKLSKDLVESGVVPAAQAEKPGLAITPFPGMAPAKPVFIQTPDVVVDDSEAKAQNLETLRAFWSYVHKRQPGLISQFRGR